MENQEIFIRDAKLEDAPRILEIYAYYVKKTAITFEYEVPTLEEFQSRMTRTMQKYPYLVIVKNGIIEGYAYAGVFKNRKAYEWSCEMTIYLDYNAKKCGLGRKLYEALEKKLEKMGILNLYACIGYPKKDDEFLTKNSAQFHEHLGYHLAGTFCNCGYKFNRWYDMICMEKFIGSRSQNQKEITIYPELPKN